MPDKLKNIPKIMHFYWGFNSPMSYLNYLTLVSFSKLNPDWQLRLYRPKRPSEYVLSQYINDKRFEYTGKDYSSELDKVKNLSVVEFEFSNLGVADEVAEVYKSDILRWHLLSTIGGGWSDMDILYIKPVAEMQTEGRMLTGIEVEIDTVIIFKDYGYHPIGFYLASQQNTFFGHLFDAFPKYFDQTEYQSVGRYMLDSLFPDEQTIRIKCQDSHICDVPSKTVYPYKPKEILFFYHSKLPFFIRSTTIGIHWFNGAKLSKKFNNKYTDNKKISWFDAIKSQVFNNIKFVENL